MLSPERVSSSSVIATRISFEDYLADYAANFCEWLDGTVIKMPSVHDYHDAIVRYLAILLEAYFEVKPIGRIRQGPFVMNLPQVRAGREPDVQIILNTNSHPLTPTFMDGPADICIEVVSPESVARDHGDKFQEYEKGGVREYWIIDYLHRECRFFRLNDDGVYIHTAEDAQGDYRTPLLSSFVFHIPILWQPNLPGPIAIGQAVQAMFNEVK